MTMPDAGASERACERCDLPIDGDGHLNGRNCVPYLKAEVARLREALADAKDDVRTLAVMMEWEVEERNAVFHAVVPECPAHPGQPNTCGVNVCDCFGSAGLPDQIRAQLVEAEARGRREMREEAAKALRDLMKTPKLDGCECGFCVKVTDAIDAIRALSDRREPT